MQLFAEWLIDAIDNFNNAIFYNGRYILIFKGLVNTLLISFGAIIVGILLGILISIIKYTHNKHRRLPILNGIFEVYTTIIRGTPMLLQLLIIYYIIFKTTNINPLFIAILAFGLNNAAYISEIFRSGLENINDGQLEAGLALGLKYPTVLFKVLMPQALKNSLPGIGNEFIALLKETSIAGYVGIIDLTRSSDIIASRIYDYFYPLVVIALIYLLLTSILNKFIKYMERRLSLND